MRDDRFSIDIPKHWLRRAVIALAVGMLVLPAAAWAGHQFTDVPNSNIFHDDIDWMKTNEVTVGCNPPANTEYCPEDNVKRQEMAAFLHRLDTKNVFVTPDEAAAMDDAQTHFAVIDEDGTATASNGLDSSTKNGTGTYTLDFGTDISDCSWTGTVGDRGEGPVANAVVTLNVGTSNDLITALVTNAPDGVLIDEDFNVTVNC